MAASNLAQLSQLHGGHRADIGTARVDEGENSDAAAHEPAEVGHGTLLGKHAAARRRTEDPAIRARLLAEYGGADDAGFADFLRAHCYDLHYTPLPGTRPWSFGQGHLWRIACDWPGSPVPPCIHRAPAQHADEPRLLLIS